MMLGAASNRTIFLEACPQFPKRVHTPLQRVGQRRGSWLLVHGNDPVCHWCLDLWTYHKEGFMGSQPLGRLIIMNPENLHLFTLRGIELQHVANVVKAADVARRRDIRRRKPGFIDDHAALITTILAIADARRSVEVHFRLATKTQHAYHQQTPHTPVHWPHQNAPL
jgi:hypothetical protein